jgi:NADP-dependent 3-hydroxy acid dehydrogenase YdfG
VTFVFALGLYHTFFQSSPFNLDNKVFLITGAGSGIGHQIASNIWKRATNATLVLLDVNHAALSELKHQLEGEQQMKSTNKVFIHRCDVSNQK